MQATLSMSVLWFLVVPPFLFVFIQIIVTQFLSLKTRTRFDSVSVFYYSAAIQLSRFPNEAKFISRPNGQNYPYENKHPYEEFSGSQAGLLA